MSELIGKMISHYRILDQIGQGGMGVVYKAKDMKLKRTVALKFLPPHLTRDKEAKTRFATEAQAASALDHQNICIIHQIDETDDGQMYIVMAYYEGETLREKVSSGQFSVDSAVEIASQIASGLVRAHEAGIVHRDIKPSNIIITERGEVKILDFGIARIAGQKAVTSTGATLGTVAYMSPEQAQARETDQRTDLWSLGVILHEMFTGEQPFKGEYDQVVLYEIVNQEPEPVQKRRPEIPPELQEIVNRALAKNPESRYASATEVLQQLQANQTGLQHPGAGKLTLKTLMRQTRKPRFAIPAMLIIAVICFFAVRYYNASAKMQWARSTALPQIDHLLEKQKFGEAFSLALQAERYIPDDPLLRKLLQSCSVPVWLKTTPPGAEVYCRDYLSVDAGWEYLGRTLLDSIRAPIGYLRWRIGKEGYEPIEGAFGGWWA